MPLSGLQRHPVGHSAPHHEHGAGRDVRRCVRELRTLKGIIMAEYRFTMAADRYDPPRNYLHGTIVTDQGYDRRSHVLTFDEGPRESLRTENGIYVLDYGTHIEVRYVAGWNLTDRYRVFLQAFPLNDGTQRSDNGLRVDFSGWMLGPRNAFHLKMTEVSK